MKKQKFLSRVKAVVLLLVIFASPVIAQGVSGAISRGYLTDDSGLRPGMAVRISTDSAEAKKVERASIDTADKFVGVVTKFEDSSITIASSKETLLVQSDGEVSAYASDVNGAIKKGDRITISPLSGILAKSTNDSTIAVGVALEDFSDKGAETHEINSVEGKKTVKLNKLKMLVNAPSTLASNQPDSSLERLGQSIAGKQVNEVRMVIAMIVFLSVIIAEGSILYGAISSAVTSVGRNPLARGAIKMELLRISVVAVIALAIGLGAVYLILWV